MPRSPKHPHNVISLGAAFDFLGVRVTHNGNLPCRTQLPEIAQENYVRSTKAARCSRFDVSTHVIGNPIKFEGIIIGHVVSYMIIQLT